ncbi:MAG: sodium:proton antiporter [Oscillospiraceae bacterium]|nr:sodium:proton antiporter [Oscillospiraceae bacterium]
MPFVNNVPFFSIFIAMLGGIVMPLIKNGRIALRVTEAAAAIIGVLSAWLLCAVVASGESFTYMMGHFPAPWGNELRAGPLEAMMALAFCMIMILGLEGGRRDMFDDISAHKQNSYCLMLNLLLASVLALVYTNDVFTAYVFIEINAISACGIVMARRFGNSLVAAVRYLVISCVGSGLFLMGIVLLYTCTGQLLMPGMDTAVQALAASGEYRVPLLIAVALVAVGLSIKSALFPFYGWLPNAYASATTSGSAVQAGLISKGYVILFIKLIYRVFTLEVMRDLHILQALFVMGLSGMIIASIRAYQEQSTKRMLGFSSAAQIAYIFMGIGLGTHEGMVAACYQILAHTITKPLLFTSAGMLIRSAHGSKNLHDLRGTARKNPLAGVGFTIGGLSLCGLPLLAGFAAKYYLGVAAMGDPKKMLFALLVLAGSSVLNAMYYLPAIVGIWFPADKGAAEPLAEEREDKGFILSTAVFIGLNIFLGVAIGPMIKLIELGLSLL